jgi:hypothetical protein
LKNIISGSSREYGWHDYAELWGGVQ